MHKIWQSIWSFLGSVPLWLKIMGIVVFPLLILVSVVVLYIRQNVLFFLFTHGYNENLPGLFPILTGQSILVLGIALLIGIGLAYGLSLILVRPLSQLLAVIRRVKDGDLSSRVAVWANDEIGHVQEAFNDMTAQLEQSQDELLFHNRELVAVNELAEALTLGQGVDAVVGTALNRVINLMDAEVGSIYLLEKEGATLKLKASQGVLSPKLILAIANTEKGPMQCLLETGHAFILEDVRTASGLSADLASMLARDGFISWACAPLKMEGEVTGVYHLGKRSKRSFDSQDLALLEVIGNVVGSSLSNAQLLKDLRRKEAELRRALHRAVELQEDERKRLARELHDEVGQALTSILIRLKTLQEEQDTQAKNDRLDDLRSLTAQTIEELRRLAMDLRPAALDNLGIVPALQWYTQQCAERTGLDVQFFGPEKSERLSSETELILYRVAQEGITNAIRHGKAQKIEVILEREPRIIRLKVRDNGRGFNAVVLDHGLGLVGIRERVELLDGNFIITAAPGAGTQLMIELPLKR